MKYERVSQAEIASDPELLAQAFSKAAQRWGNECDAHGDSWHGMPSMQTSFWHTAHAWWRIAELVKATRGRFRRNPGDEYHEAFLEALDE